MLTMQAYHDQLFIGRIAAPASMQSLRAALLRLTRLSRAKLALLVTDEGWHSW